VECPDNGIASRLLASEPAARGVDQKTGKKIAGFCQGRRGWDAKGGETCDACPFRSGKEDERALRVVLTNERGSSKLRKKAIRHSRKGEGRRKEK